MNQLNMSEKHAHQLAILLERSAFRAAKYTENEWQEYYEKRVNTKAGDTSWAISEADIKEIVNFLRQDVKINQEYFIPFYAGLSDDKKTIYFDSSIQTNLETPIGRVSPIDYVLLHERFEGAVMEQSYLDELKRGRSEIRFECPLGSADNEKLLITYKVVDNNLKLSYQKLKSTKKENDLIPSMDVQAVKQNVLSYEHGHQIAERLERVSLFAAGFGNFWEKNYNTPVMNDIEKLAKEYETAYKNNQNISRSIPSDLYILPYAQKPNDPLENYLLGQVTTPKLKAELISKLEVGEEKFPGLFNERRASSPDTLIVRSRKPKPKNWGKDFNLKL